MPVIPPLVALLAVAIPAATYAHPGVHELIASSHPATSAPSLAFDLGLAVLALLACAGWRLARGRPAIAGISAGLMIAAGGGLLFA